MTFLFDIGRVLLDFDFESSLVRLLDPPAPAVDGPPLPVAGPAATIARLARLLARKDEFESGAITADRYIAWALETLECEATAGQFVHAWQNIFTPNEAMWRHVRELAADGHRLILFSNTNTIHCPWIFETYPEFSLFPEAVLSFETGFIKPHPGIYHHAIQAHGLDPAATRYIDDLPENIATGRELGFRSFQYDLKDHTPFERWLAAELAAD
jgi:FMN phosphatase YigB (HAD superfamily)